MTKIFLLPSNDLYYKEYKIIIFVKRKDILELLLIPIVFLLAYLVIHFIWSIFDLPGREVIISSIRTWFSNYGLIFVFVSALIEGLLLFGNYFPGGLVIFLGVISAGGDIKMTVLTVLVVCIALYFAYTINYFLGKYGWYKLFAKFGFTEAIENTKKKLIKHQLKAILASYWMPNLASITATGAGVLKLPFKKFMLQSLIGVLVWNSLWGALVGILGERALTLISMKWVLIVFVIWICIILIQRKISQKNYTHQSN